MQKKHAIIILSVCIVVAAIFIIMLEVVIPSSKYNDAEKFLEENKYLNAVELYEELGNYKDSADKAISTRYLLALCELENKEYKKAYDNFFLIIDYEDSLDRRNESGYAYATQLFADEKYEEALRIFEVIKEYKDSAEFKNQCYLNMAKQLFDAKDYYGVITMYEQNGPFSENNELYKSACYNYGLEKSNSGNTETAIFYFTKADDFSDAKEQIKLEKYKYIKSNMDKNNPITFEYLTELGAEDYSDSRDIYYDWYSWKVEVIAVNSDIGNRVTKRKSISKRHPVIFHYELTGGAPNATMIVKIKVKFPNGETVEDESDWVMKDGSINWYGWESGIYESEYGSEGTLTIEFYDHRNNLVGSGSIEITK